jgi:hypothetical protein
VQEADPDDEPGRQDQWELAGKLAARMLPQVFKPQSPVFELAFAPEHQRELERLLAALPPEVFKASDSLGWVYQFWQAKRKDEVNASEVKIGADELPAVTQLFTEPYMVDFLLHNSLGAWWVTRHPGKTCPVPLTYLRTLDDGTPAAGKFEGWPDRLDEFKLLDPCCGSGHFLVAAFLLLVPMRMAAEGLSAMDAVDAVLADNLHGLELDARCVEIAVFALALAAWRFPDENGDPLGVRADMPAPQVACCGLKVAAKPEDWMALVPDDAPTRLPAAGAAPAARQLCPGAAAGQPAGPGAQPEERPGHVQLRHAARPAGACAGHRAPGHAVGAGQRAAGRQLGPGAHRQGPAGCGPAAGWALPPGGDQRALPGTRKAWQQVAAERYPNGLPKPYSDDPTQWLFHGHPQPATDPLQVAVARLVGYRWPAETDAAMELADEARTWIARCDKLAEHTDDDGIVCLPSVRGETPAHDRLLKLLIAAWETVQPGSWKPACSTSCWPMPTAPARAWTCGCATSSSSSTPSASTTAPSSGTCGTA